MNSEEFIEAVRINCVKGEVFVRNEKYKALMNEYITDNTPCKVGLIYVVDDVGVRTDFNEFKKRNRAFIVRTMDIEYMPDGSPLIVADGSVHVNGNHTVKDDDIVGTFRCVIHGSMGSVKFKNYVGKIGK